jgi:hypothetical protein
MGIKKIVVLAPSSGKFNHRSVGKDEEDDNDGTTISVATQKFFDKLRGLPFWICWGNQQAHEIVRQQIEKTTDGGGFCCFNHAIGLPENKPGLPQGMFPYEKEIYDSINRYRRLWIKKARGLGVTEFALRYIAWRCLVNDDWKGGKVFIITGPNMDLAITLIDRIKQFFPDDVQKDRIFKGKERVAILNGVKCIAMPSDNIDASRGATDVKLILNDEADFFSPGQQQDVRAVTEGYIQKTNPIIMMVSTPHEPEGLFEQIENEPEATCLYKRIFLPYTVGLGYIYTQKEIDTVRNSPEFERELNLKYIGQLGNVFSDESIERAIKYGIRLEELRKGTIPLDTRKTCGVDAGFGSSNTGIVVIQMAYGKLEVIFAEEYKRPDIGELVDLLVNLRTRYGIKTFRIDAANVPVIKALKRVLGEPMDYHEHLARIQRKKLGDPVYHMDVIPVAFNPEGREMLVHSKMALDKGKVAIHPKHNKLIVALRTAVAKEMLLNKEKTSFDDLFDGFRLALSDYGPRDKIIK